MEKSSTKPRPLIHQRADPFVVRHADGHYYFTATVPEYDRIIIRKSDTMDGLSTAIETTVWHKHDRGPMSAHIWAPELHHIDGKWFIYFAAGKAEDIWAIRMYVLENPSRDPTQGVWIERGQIQTKWDSFSLDATTFEHRGQRYLVWAQHDPSEASNTDLYLAKMKSPTEIEGEPLRLSRPEYAWEAQLFKVNEGPAVVVRRGRVFIAYSASGTDWRYCMGLLWADEDADLLDARSWTKSAQPVYSTDEAAGLFGPGHNSFTISPTGQDLMVFHARQYKEIEGDPLRDPNRHTFVAVVDFFTGTLRVKWLG